jgi:putative ABC transport system ATP-binding protein
MAHADRTGDIRVEAVRYRWPGSGFELRVDQLHVAAGRRLAVIGPSGSGKTTLLNLLAGILVPDSGTITVAGQPLSQLSDAARRRFRIRHIGMVFQQFELVPYLRTLDNCLVPFYVNPAQPCDAAARERAGSLLQQTGLANRLRSFPRQLSQGEQQRLALCRALVTQPPVLLADEPTGNLDAANKFRVLDLMLEQVTHRGVTLVVVTHDTTLLDRFDEVIDFGQLVAAESRP